MGIYLNSKKAALLYQKETRALYFVDKTPLVDELIGFLESGETDLIQPDTGNRALGSQMQRQMNCMRDMQSGRRNRRFRGRD